MAATIQVKVTADVTEAQRAIDQLTSKQVSVKIGGNAKSATDKLNALNQELTKLGNKRYVVKVDTGIATSGLNKLQTASTKTGATLNNLLKTASKYATWYAMGTAITTMVNAFSDAIDTMKKVDTQLTNIKKVSADADIEGISQRVYENASKYGVAAEDFTASIYEFQKAGYGDASEQMAELATKTMLVGDTTASVADKFLIVADTAWNMGHSIEDLNMLIDEADYINNNYATSLDKLAEGFPRVASVASMAGMSAEETMAALGTITASTQETASKAGTALRALILNILKDTTTEVEDGVTVTEDQIKSLRGVLNVYAKDVVAAADATGELINPMEAISALSKAYKSGLLTATDLYQIENALGGKLRTNQLDALLKNFDTTYTSMMEGMKTAAGTADKEIDTMMNSWEKKVQVLQNTFTQFVANTVNTDWIKGILDGLTTIIDAAGNLGNVLMVIFGLITGLKAGTVITELGVAFANMALSVGMGTAAIDALTVGLSSILPIAGLIIAAIGAATIAWNAYKKSVAEAAVSAKETSAETSKELDTIAQARQNFEYIHAAYEKGIVTKEQYLQATKDLSKAMGEEVYGYTSYANYSEKVNEQVADSYQKAAVAQQDALEKQAKALAVTAGYLPEIGKTTIEQADEIVENYDRLSDELAHGRLEGVAKQSAEKWIENVKEQAEAYKEFRQEVQDNPVVNPDSLWSRTADVIENGLKLQLAMAQLKQSAADADLQKEIEAWGEGYETLASKIDSATTALQKFSDQTASQKGDSLSGYAKAYESFLTDWESGFKGSTNVLSAIDLFFSPEQIAYWHKQGVELGEVLSNDMFQAFFKNAEGEFTSGADFGANFANYLNDTFADASGNITDEAGNVIASFQKVGEEGSESLQLLVNDTDALAAKLGTTPEFIAALQDALSVYSSSWTGTSEEIIAMANEIEGAITGISDGVASVDASTFFSGLLESGQATQEQLYDIAEQAQNMPEIQLTVEGQEATAEQIEQVIEDCAKINETPAEAEITGENSEAVSAAEEAQQAAEEFANGDYTAILNGDNSPLMSSVDEAVAYASSQSITIPVTADTSGVTTAAASVTATAATGATNYKGGLTLVNEEGPEIIAENGQARIANGGLPTLTYIQKGATIFDADDTRQILDNSGVKFFSGAKAMASGNYSGIPISSNYYGGSGSSSGGGSSDSGYSGGGGGGGSSGGGGGGGSSSSSDSESETDEQLEALKDIVALRKSELGILEATNASTKEQADKEWEIMDALKAEWTYLQESGGDQKEINDLIAEFWETRQKIVELYKDEYETQASLKESEIDLLEKTDASVKSQIDKQNEIKAIYKKEMEYLIMFTDDQEEINKLKAKQLDIEKEIAELRKGMYDDLREGIDNEIDAIEKERDAQTKLIDDRIKALQDEHDLKEETEELEEKILAVQEAEANLQKAQNERTVRYFNAATGQWEWGANAKDVQSATEALEDAQKNLEEAYYQQEISDLEKEKELIEEEADARIKEWEEIKEVIAEPLLTVAEAIAELSRSADKSMKGTVDALNALLAKFGYKINTTYDSGGVLSGLGGIKATARDEMVLPPEITSRMLSPTAGNLFMQRLSELGYLYGGRSLAGTSSNIGTQNIGDTYNFGNITLTKEQAKNTTVYQLAKLSRGLRAYSAAN